MAGRFRERFRLLKGALAQPWVKRLMWLFVLIGIYDTSVGQLLPRETGQDTPNIYEILEGLAIWSAQALPWWAWVMAILITITVAAIEYAVRLNRKLSISEFAKLKVGAEPRDEDRRFTVDDLRRIADMVGTSEQSKLRRETFVALYIDGSTYAFIDSFNVSSVTDSGVGDITINFSRPFKAEYFLLIKSDHRPDWEILEKTASSCRIKFHGSEPSRMMLTFEEYNKTDDMITEDKENIYIHKGTTSTIKETISKRGARFKGFLKSK